MTGSCAPASSPRLFRPSTYPADTAAAAGFPAGRSAWAPDPAAHAPAESAAAGRRLSDHWARARHLWSGAASGAAIGAFDPWHARRSGGRHLRARRLRRGRCGRAGRPADQEATTRAPCPLFSPSVWGRFFGQTLNNHYSAFADPRASGNIGGFQGGIDLLRGSLIAGHSERAGLYGAYGDVNADVDGLVTNPAATAYVLTHTGSMNLTPGRRAATGPMPGPAVGISTPCCKGHGITARPAPNSLS